MTKLSVVSTFTTIVGSGMVCFDCNVEETTVGAVKKRVQELTEISAQNQSIWWRGYILDDDDLPLIHACVGVNKGEKIDKDIGNLVLFVTVAVETKYRRPPTVLESTSPPIRRVRLSSFGSSSGTSI